MRSFLLTCFLVLGILSCKKNSEKSLFKTVLVLGNSITICNPVPAVGWNGKWGMAASAKSEDFIHLLEAKYKLLRPEVTVTPVNIANWEMAHDGFVLSELDVYLSSNPDLVIIRLGENIQSLTNLDISFGQLIDHIKNKLPQARIIVTGLFWKNDPIDKVLSDVAASKSLLFVPMSHLDKPENKSFLGDTVMDWQGIPYKITHQGVADHPGDLGMKEISDLIYSATVH